ncbi:MAG: TonB-dependent receptor [Labilibaculum sp.]|nr:TonB-dependent receptor [Labilibaculum sp.]MBI9058893.1 TonB-dependent receptor [Labilibaculum sp.]
MKILVFIFLVAFLSITPLLVAAQVVDAVTAKKLTMLSFDDLMRVEITSASLTGVEKIKTPGSITTITKEDIQATPYRNLLDLLEVYVPSGTFVNHWLGPRIGVRGVMSDQNYSYLLLVNGENMNLQTENGAIFEIQNKDLADIEKIEITSGPGSVIHGPGAIGGVISITTKSAKTADKANIGFNRDFTYKYSTLNGNYSVAKKDFSAYLFASITKSEGIENPEFYYIDRAHGYGYGYMSADWGNKDLGTPAPNFYADFDNRPEIKAHLNIDFLKEFSFDARYTSFSFIKQQQQTYSQEGPAFPGIYGQQFMSVLKNNHEFSKKTQLTSSLSYQSQSHGDIALYQATNKPFNDITQRNTSYSENKINARSILSYQASGKLKLALGAEYNYWYYRPEWGKAEDNFVMDFNPPVKFAVMNTNSGFYSQYNQFGIVTHIDKTIGTNQISGFFEVNYQPTENTTVLVSGRFDKHKLAKSAFSPRVAIIQQLDKNNFLKLIAQQSVRVPGFRELYAIDYASGNASAPEKLNGIEFIYSRIQSQNFTMNVSAFYQSIDQIAWLTDDGEGLVGTFETFGIETDISYKINNLNLALSYSYIRQLSWEPVFEFNSYLSRIGVDSLDMPLVDAGANRINNLPQHQIKFVSSYSFNKSLFIHIDGRFASQYGQNDMLNMFKDIHDTYGLDHTKNEMNAIYSDVVDKGYGKSSFTSNVSVRYLLPVKKANVAVTAYAMNLISFNHIRYVHQFWEEGNNRQYPRQIGFVNEPLSIGLKLEVKL